MIKRVLTPFTLDYWINNREKKLAKGDAMRDSIVENVRVLLQSEKIFEDEAVGMLQHALSEDEISAMDNETRASIMLG